MNKVRATYCLTFFVSIFIFYSCKIQENTVKVKVNHRTTRFLIDEMLQQEFQFNTLSTKVNIEFDNGKKTSFKAHLRIKKDSVIWISITPALGIEIARVMITQDSVMMMNRKDNQYFIGTMEYINKLFGTDIDYQMLEALLIGNSLDFEENEKIRSSIDRQKDLYFLSTEKKRKIRKEIKKDKGKIKEQTQTLWLDPLTYKIRELLLSSPESSTSLLAQFSDYREVTDTAASQILPHKLVFTLTSDTAVTIFNVEYQKLKLDETMSFSFKIPSKYEQIKE